MPLLQQPHLPDLVVQLHARRNQQFPPLLELGGTLHEVLLHELFAGLVEDGLAGEQFSVVELGLRVSDGFLVVVEEDIESMIGMIWTEFSHGNNFIMKCSVFRLLILIKPGVEY